MIEIIFQIIGEFLFQASIEILIELGFHSVREPFKRSVNPQLVLVGYAIFGAATGGLSLLILPVHLTPESWRIANLVLTPVAVGLLMAAFGAFRVRRGQPLLHIDRFAFGYVFALSLALVRYQFAGAA